jgi:uncharacterized protein YsxB (DUF464 family)
MMPEGTNGLPSLMILPVSQLGFLLHVENGILQNVSLIYRLDGVQTVPHRADIVCSSVSLNLSVFFVTLSIGNLSKTVIHTDRYRGVNLKMFTTQGSVRFGFCQSSQGIIMVLLS